ncbi:hypothetical protein Taro_037932 [Colocasia esculenta]|uniref:Uncharacterized protein n=1 Tax=Colocasia esculenta TaxID=4460 RepID=A0A843WBA0_COLES|nr:hypothetical protein [Colocasia esculenta]
MEKRDGKRDGTRESKVVNGDVSKVGTPKSRIARVPENRPDWFGPDWDRPILIRVFDLDARQALCNDLKEIHQRHLLQAAIVREALDCLSAADHESLLEDCKKKRSHIPLMIRPTERESC